MTNGRFKIFRCGIQGIDAVASDTCHVFPRHTHEQFGIGAVDRGAQKSLSGRGMVEAGPGDAITVNPGEVHDGAPIGDAGRAWRILYFDPSLIADATNDMSEGKRSVCEFAHPVIRDPRVVNRLRKLFSVVTRGDKDKTALKREELLLMLLSPVLQKRVAGASIPNAIFEAKSLIDDDPARSITLADLAQVSGLSRFQVLRAFVRSTGLTPHSYLVQRRIDVARRLIAVGTRLAEAAAASGFSDQSHMTRIFVRRYGISPGAYADAMT
jgi:AraC-like DNA-binding protein